MARSFRKCLEMGENDHLLGVSVKKYLFRTLISERASKIVLGGSCEILAQLLSGQSGKPIELLEIAGRR
jgi:hypothetical protein